MTPGTAYALMAVTIVIGGGSLLLSFAFVIAGPFPVVDLHFSRNGVLLWDAALSVLFFVQHSGMTRASFRERLARVMPSYYHGSVFALASGIALAAVALLWQATPDVFLRLQGVPRVLARLLSVVALLGMVWGFKAIGAVDLLGLTPIRAHLRHETPPSSRFMVRGPYLWVRHPVYFCTLLFIWSGPDITSDRLLFIGLWTAWILLGVCLEERDLVRDFGAQYRQYQREVPMLLPWRGRVRAGR